MTAHQTIDQRGAAPISMPRSAPIHMTLLAWLALVALPPLVGAGSAFVATQQMTPIHGASADIVLHVQGGGETVSRYLATQSVIASSNSVLAPVANAFSTSIKELRKNLTVSFPERGSIMRLQYANADPGTAMGTLEAILSHFVPQLERIEWAEGTSHQRITAPHLLAEPVWPQPLKAAAIGFAAGILVTLAAVASLQFLQRQND